VAALDIELFERAVANLVDNALKFCRSGDRITLAARVVGERGRSASPTTVRASTAADVPQLFDRFYQSRQSVAPATGEGGKGLAWRSSSALPSCMVATWRCAAIRRRDRGHAVVACAPKCERKPTCRTQMSQGNSGCSWRRRRLQSRFSRQGTGTAPRLAGF
jgi:hypothetical protein